MKSILISFALFFLFAITTTLPSASATVVLDVAFNPVRNGETYYIIPTIPRGIGGGVELNKTGGNSCPITIVQSPFRGVNGLPIIIESLTVSDNDDYIKENHLLRLSFSDNDVPSCSSVPTKWGVVKDEAIKKWSLKLVPTEQRVLFFIEHANFFNNYRLRFVALSSNLSGYVGTYIDDNGIYRLVMADENTFPWLIQFKSAADSEVAARRIK